MTEPTDSPAHEAARAELTKVWTDKTHPDHAAYMKGDEKVVAKYQEHYKQAYGTGQPSQASSQGARVSVAVGENLDGRHPGITGSNLTSSNDLEERFQRAQESALASVRQEQGDDFQPDIAQDPNTIAAALQQEWGDRFPQNLAGVANMRQQLIEKDPQLVAEVGLLVGDLRAYKLLHRLRELIDDLRPG
jgi:hypothetical protein